MQSLFVLILVSAGVLMALMGAFLIASERELKSKRREVETLLAKLEEALQGKAPIIAAQQDNSVQLAELRAANQDLQSQITGLSHNLELSRRTIAELEATQQSHTGDQDQARELRATNEQLRMEVNDLRSRLEASEARGPVTEAAHQDASQPQVAQAQAEIAGLRQKLDDSQAKIHRLETAQRNAVNIDTLEAKHLEETQRLQARITEMDKEISTEREKLRELDALRARCAESEQSQQALRDEIRRRDEEIPRWQARIAEAEAHREQLSALQKPYSELLSKQVSMLEKQRELQEDLEAFARLMGGPTDTLQTKTSFASSVPSQPPAAQSTAPAEEHRPTTAGAQPEPKRARRFGIFPVVILLLAAGVLGTWHVGVESPESTVPTVTASMQSHDASQPAQPQPETSPEPDGTTVTPHAAAAPTAVKVVVRPAVKDTGESASMPAVKRSPRVDGTYQITRASRVYAGPSEFSQSIGDIGAGVKVSVVDSRDGWLEIHSKHGRPPGYVRSEVATRVGAPD